MYLINSALDCWFRGVLQNNAVFIIQNGFQLSGFWFSTSATISVTSEERINNTVCDLPFIVYFWSSQKFYQSTFNTDDSLFVSVMSWLYPASRSSPCDFDKDIESHYFDINTYTSYMVDDVIVLQ